VQKTMIWFDRRMGPLIGTDKRVAKADIRAMDDEDNFDFRDPRPQLCAAAGCHDR
jgi:hypothetical protein